jgi:hypothetical protein
MSLMPDNFLEPSAVGAGHSATRLTSSVGGGSLHGLGHFARHT